MRNDEAQMMMLEAIFFAITVVIALILLFQMSPTSIQSGSQSSNELKRMGDNALSTIYAETQYIKPLIDPEYVTNNPSSKLVVCIITNDYIELTDSINNILPDSALYNIYISNGIKTVFWCTSTGDVDEPLAMFDPIAISHHPISIDPIHLDGFNIYNIPPNQPSVLKEKFNDYDGATYEVILEMSYIWI